MTSNRHRAPASARSRSGAAAAGPTRTSPKRPRSTTIPPICSHTSTSRPSRAESVLTKFERDALPLREDVGLHRLQLRVVIVERLPPRRVLDAPVDHVAEQRDAAELNLELRIGFRVRIRGVRMAHVARDRV